MIKVEKDIPLPSQPRGGRPPGYGKYPWATLEIGDSFLGEAKVKSMRVQASVMRRRHGRKYTVLQMPEGVRVWRIE